MGSVNAARPGSTKAPSKPFPFSFLTSFVSGRRRTEWSAGRRQGGALRHPLRASDVGPPHAVVSRFARPARRRAPRKQQVCEACCARGAPPGAPPAGRIRTPLPATGRDGLISARLPIRSRPGAATGGGPLGGTRLMWNIILPQANVKPAPSKECGNFL